MSKNSPEAHAEYADLITSLLLCEHFNPRSDKALRKCLKLVKRRLKTSHIKRMCYVVMTTSKILPSVWLGAKVIEIEEIMPLDQFLVIARSRVSSS